ncbi:Sip1-related alpha-galactosidase [Cohnella hashimotonis]|uniref:Sip1-related alpha-galactosidase n=1 Tax=Cohnella hashimotonis TaxID=2826895 RepID=A0ABT6TN20_9BACL|nr:Sip1-related alpha-galactosidase [Cohnella hashimotonis]
MFDWLLTSGAKEGNDGQAIWASCTVRLNEPGGVPAELRLPSVSDVSTNGDKNTLNETRYAFADEKGGTRVTFIIRQKGDCVTGHVEAELANENVFGSQRTFAQANAIELRLDAGAVPGRWMAVYQHKDWWTRPAFGADWRDIPMRTQSLLCGDGERYLQVLPVSGGAIRADVSGCEAGIVVRLTPGGAGMTRLDTLAFVMGAGEDPYALIERHAAVAAESLGRTGLLRSNKTYPPMLDRLGWCSWDAFYHKVNEEGLLQKAEELQRLGVPAGWFMIDDGWSDVRDGKLARFEADREKFPGGLGHTIGQLKKRFDIRHVGVWHTIAGYWGGIDLQSEEARIYGRSLRTNGRGQLLPSPEPGEAFGFWHGWHDWLSRQGVDFVKVDSQSAVSNFWAGTHAVGEAVSASHASLEASVALHFDAALINCMGMAAESVWHRPKSAVSRSSDDFVPQDLRGFAEHALQNAYNSYWHGAFYWGDWDMFWTRHQDARAGALLRAISGGPVYVSDPPDQTDPALLQPLAYRDGTLLRCDRVAVPAPDCLLLDPTREALPLKLWNTSGGAGVVAVFRIDAEPGRMEASIGPGDVPGLGGESFALHEHGSGKADIVGRGEALPLDLAPGDSAIWTVAPLADGFAPLGRLDKFAGSHAVLSCAADSRGGMRIRVREGGGPFGFVTDRLPLSARANGEDVEVKSAGARFYTVELPEGKGECYLEIELAAAGNP